MRYVTPKIRRCRKNGKVRYLRQGRELRDQGFPLPPPFQPDLEGECPPCQGGRRRDSVPCQRVYTVPPFRQGHARGINCVCWKSSAWQGFFLLPGGFRACTAGRFLRAIQANSGSGAAFVRYGCLGRHTPPELPLYNFIIRKRNLLPRRRDGALRIPAVTARAGSGRAHG